MQLILDERETALYEKVQSCYAYLQSSANSTSPEIDIKKRVLPLADVLILDKDGRELIMVERKSLTDLLASIKDGRYEEQSYRLIQSSGHIPHHIIYVIEGMMSQLRGPAEKTLVYSAMTSLNMIKGFSVIRTSSVQETAEWLVATTRKLGRDLAKGKMLWAPSEASTTITSTGPIDPSEPQTVLNYCSVVKKIKKDNIVPANIGEIILSQIPGISTVSALAIMERFGSIGNLIDQMRADPTCLDGITCKTNGHTGPNPKSRKLSKTIIEHVRQYLLYCPTAPALGTGLGTGLGPMLASLPDGESTIELPA